MFGLTSRAESQEEFLLLRGLAFGMPLSFFLWILLASLVVLISS